MAGIIKETLSGHVGLGSSANLTGCRADNQTIQTRGVCERALKFRFGREGFQGNAIAANRTREIRPSGMRGGLAETRIWKRLNGHVKRKRRNSQAFS